MKNIVIFSFSLVLIMSCSKSDDMQIVIEQMGGDFVARAHPTSGKRAVNSDKTILTFTNFKTDNGPKLLVYLSTDVISSEYINLGDLRGVSGDFTYEIPTNTDLEKFKIANIWCVDFSVSFGTAELKK
ncbi:DM13 domain-containing protein [Lutibacter sp.]|uniref:DM13 domain-containing protein n=1 Tax=Lutibacter sp. TaxID=1925666 RepID=UPI003569CE2B